MGFPSLPWVRQKKWIQTKVETYACMLKPYTGFIQTTQSFTSYRHIQRFQYYVQNGFCSKQDESRASVWKTHVYRSSATNFYWLPVGNNDIIPKELVLYVLRLMWRQTRTASWKSSDSTGALVETPLSFSAHQALTAIKLHLQLLSYICSPLLHIQAKSLSWFIRHVSIVTFKLHPLQMTVKTSMVKIQLWRRSIM